MINTLEKIDISNEDHSTKIKKPLSNNSPVKSSERMTMRQSFISDLEVILEEKKERRKNSKNLQHSSKSMNEVRKSMTSRSRSDAESANRSASSKRRVTVDDVMNRL